MGNKILIVGLALMGIVLHVSADDTVPSVKQGVLDLRGHKIEKFHEISFNGEWEFYWNKLLYQADFDTHQNIEKTCFIDVPSVWTDVTVKGENLPAFGGATYRITVLLDKGFKKEMGLRLGSHGTATRIYVNGKLINEAGVVSLDPEIAKPGYFGGVKTFIPDSDTLSLLFQISNFNYNKGGIWSNFDKIGTAENMRANWSHQIEILLLFLGSIIIIGIYHFGLFVLTPSFRAALYFTFFCSVIAVRAICVDEIYLLSVMPNFNWHALVKLEYLTLVVGALSFILYIISVFKNESSKYFYIPIIAISGLNILLIIFTPTWFFTRYLGFYQLIIAITAGYALFVVFKALFRKNKSAQLLTIGLSILIAAIVNDILVVNRVIDSVLLTTYGFIFFIVNQAYVLSHRYSSMLNEIALMAKNLEGINANLEKTVEERTSEIKEQNGMLLQQNDEIKAQRDNIERQHEIVSKQKLVITDSINYAQKLQQAVLPSKAQFIGQLSDYFILYRPKDIVSGDFYWTTTISGKTIIVVADCTGHGVPGAIMSMLGVAFLSEISRIPEIKTAAEYLEFLREKVKHSLRQKSMDSIQKEGMDMSLCIYDSKSKIMQFAGAYNDLYLIRNGELEAYRADRQPIAVYLKEKDFTNYTINVESTDRFYMMTDGYVDQIGGAVYKKFMLNRFKKLLLEIYERPMEEQGQILEQNFEEWKGTNVQIDDVLVMGFTL